MANCCLDTVVFHSLEGCQEDFNRLKDAVSACFSIASITSDASFDRLFIYAGLPTDEIYLRGTMVHKDIQDTCLTLWCDSCWIPLSDAYRMISEFYHVGYVYCAEEPGCGIYVNTDASGRFLNNRYKVILYWEEEVFDHSLGTLMQNAGGDDADFYFPSKDKLLQWFEENGGITASSAEELSAMFPNESVAIHLFE